MKIKNKYDAACMTIAASAKLQRLMYQQSIPLQEMSIFRLLARNGYRYNSKEKRWHYVKRENRR